MTKVTDLEKFALEQVYRPYANKLLMVDTRFDRLCNHYQLDDIMLHFKDNPEWEKLVMNRIVGLLFTFPDYINHPLVEHIKQWKKDKLFHED